MANYFRDNDDLRFYVERGIDWDPLVRVTEQDYRSPGSPADAKEAAESYAGMLDLVGTLAAEQIGANSARIDREAVRFAEGEASFPPLLQSIADQAKELGLHGLCIPRELGGMNSPLVLYFLVSEMLARGDASFMTHFGFHGGMALAMLVFSVREGTTKADPQTGVVLETRFKPFIEEIARGEAWGCMDITEPDAGSDMAALRTVGEQDERGDWFVSGRKTFITSGHGKYHFVIARTEKAAAADDPFGGLKGLSMFLVPAWRDEPDGRRTRFIQVGRVEEKIGHHGSVTAELHFDRAPAMLIGKRGEGFEYMLVLMNNARVGVAFESLGVCEAALRLAEAYAAERRSMGRTIDKHEMVADYLDEMRTDIQAIRALGVYAAIQEEMGQKLALRARFADLDAQAKADLERRVRRHRRNARRATPLLKYFAAEKAVEISRRCVQIHGGVGYTKDYGAEKLLRDALVMPIYEGTSQIQSLMAMKDTLGGIMKNPQGFLRHGAQARWRAVSARDPLERRVARLQTLSFSAQQHLIVRTAGDKFRAVQTRPVTEWATGFLRNWNPKRDFAFAMLHAERLTRILADEVVAEVLLEQARRHPERRDVLERWLERAEPRCRWLLDEITNTGDRLLRKLQGGAEDRKAG